MLYKGSIKSIHNIDILYYSGSVLWHMKSIFHIRVHLSLFKNRSFSITSYSYRIMGFVEEPFQFVELVNGEVRSGSSLLPCNDHNVNGPSVTSIDSKMFSGLNSPDPSSLLVVAAEDGLCGSNLLESPVQRQERESNENHINILIRNWLDLIINPSALLII